MPNKEKREIIVGLDEVGRGALAGPVVACAMTVQQASKIKYQMLGLKIKDSKKLSPKRREEIFEFLKNSPQIEWGIGKVFPAKIDKINILQATKLAMVRAVKNLEKKVKKKADYLLIDGNFTINSDITQKSIIKGDEKVFSCAVASVIAKVTRDRMMIRYHKRYPRYGFDKHKGYPTKFHRQIIKKYGFCKIHRRSFRVS